MADWADCIKSAFGDGWLIASDINLGGDRVSKGKKNFFLRQK